MFVRLVYLCSVLSSVMCGLSCSVYVCLLMLRCMGCVGVVLWCGVGGCVVVCGGCE